MSADMIGSGAFRKPCDRTLAAECDLTTPSHCAGTSLSTDSLLRPYLVIPCWENAVPSAQSVRRSHANVSSDTPIIQ